LSASALDLLGGKRSESAATTLVGVGVVSAVPTVAAGLSDWSDTIGEERRIGLVHASSNLTAVVCYGLSYLARRRGQRQQGLSLGFLGATAMTAGAYLGGHLVYRLGVWVDRNIWTEGAREWQAVLDETELAQDEHVVVRAGDEDVLLVRCQGQVHAVANTCGHAGGPLHEGTFDQEGCVTCPWHGSTFRLADGRVVRGPATGPQPAYDVRLEDGKVSLRRRPA
jgi:nitrite reductase/ring-hydroxylating ferredoxin subunit